MLALKYSITQLGPKYHSKVLLQITKILPHSIINFAGTKVFHYPAGTKVPLQSIVTNYKDIATKYYQLCWDQSTTPKNYYKLQKYCHTVLSIVLALKYSITQLGPKYHSKVLLQITKILPNCIIDCAGTKLFHYLAQPRTCQVAPVIIFRGTNNEKTERFLLSNTKT